MMVQYLADGRWFDVEIRWSNRKGTSWDGDVFCEGVAVGRVWRRPGQRVKARGLTGAEREDLLPQVSADSLHTPR